MQAANSEHKPSDPSSSPAQRWRQLALDALLELAAAREALYWHNKDAVEATAASCFLAYSHLGGTRLTLDAWRSLTRELFVETREK